MHFILHSLQGSKVRIALPGMQPYKYFVKIFHQFWMFTHFRLLWEKRSHLGEGLNQENRPKYAHGLQDRTSEVPSCCVKGLHTDNWEFDKGRNLKWLIMNRAGQLGPGRFGPGTK